MLAVMERGGRWPIWLAGCALAGFVALALNACGPDCVWAHTIVAGGGRSSVTLTAAEPVAEQLVTVRLNAAALPTDVPTVASLVITRPYGALAPTATPAAPPEIPPVTSPEITVVDATSGVVIPATATWTGRSTPWDQAFFVASIVCPVGGACERAYRVRVAAPGLANGAEVAFAWQVTAGVEYTGIDERCGAPDGAKASIEASTPVPLPAGRVAFAGRQDRGQPAGPIAAHRVTVSAEGGLPASASMRLSILPLATVQTHAWVRVLPDGSSEPVADLQLGGPQGWWVGPPGGTVDIPVLGGCPAGGECRRGYWVLVQSMSQAPGAIAQVANPPPPAVGRFAWGISATAVAPDGAAASGSRQLVVAIDDEAAPGPWLESTLAATAEPVAVTAVRTPTVIDATLTVPTRPDREGGLDPLAAAVVIVHVSGSGAAFRTSLEGDGAAPLTGYLNGVGDNLVAHPFDACPPEGPCRATLRLVGLADPSGPDESRPIDATLEWSLDVVGAPPGTLVTFGEPYVVRPAPPILAIAAAAGVIVALVVLLARRLRRRARRTEPGPG